MASFKKNYCYFYWTIIGDDLNKVRIHIFGLRMGLKSGYMVQHTTKTDLVLPSNYL